MSSLWSALLVVFVAELGDKTQLVALGFGARHRLAPVLVGIAVAYFATNLLSVVVGGLLGETFPAEAISLGGGILFLGFAAWTLRDTGEDDPVDDPGAQRADMATSRDGSTFRTVMAVAGAMFIAELGDKTMLATATLAARGQPVMVWIGATIGIFLAGALGVLAGRALGVRLPERTVRIGSAVLFAGFGVALIISAIH
ncbi:MAG: UPF0016 domain-containing protein [Actinobacteria bacterium]|nr:MAG: UPF0016 domain-containing protein [Actinomycetota bacterium]